MILAERSKFFFKTIGIWIHKQQGEKNQIKKFIADNSLNWDLDNWLSKEDKLKDCIWFEGSILKHPEEKYIYFAPQPSEIGVI